MTPFERLHQLIPEHPFIQLHLRTAGHYNNYFNFILKRIDDYITMGDDDGSIVITSPSLALYVNENWDSLNEMLAILVPGFCLKKMVQEHEAPGAWFIVDKLYWGQIGLEDLVKNNG